MTITPTPGHEKHVLAMLRNHFCNDRKCIDFMREWAGQVIVIASGEIIEDIAREHIIAEAAYRDPRPANLNRIAALHGVSRKDVSQALQSVSGIRIETRRSQIEDPQFRDVPMPLAPVGPGRMWRKRRPGPKWKNVTKPLPGTHASPITCWETGQKYGSVAKAARANPGSSPTAIQQARDTGGQCAGLHWHDPSVPESERPAMKGMPWIECVETGEVYIGRADAIAVLTSRVNGGAKQRQIASLIRADKLPGHTFVNVPLERRRELVERLIRPNPTGDKDRSGLPGRERVGVVCVETGEKFGSIAAATKAKGLKRSSIGFALSYGGRAGGHYWRRV